MYSVDVAIEKFKEILAGKTAWSDLIDSQFVEHLSTFVGWAIRQAQWAVERAKQEFFISSALNRSSLVAHAEDREYIPRKASPASGVLSITNNGENSISIPMGVEFVNESDITVTTIEAVTIVAGGTATVSVEQKEAVSHSFTVDEESAFYEVLIPAENSAKVAEFSVYVNLNDGEGYREWSYSRLLQNSYSDSQSYDEFYHYTDQIGIRFGNGTFGLIPVLNSLIRVDTWETDGDVFLSQGQEAFVVDELTDSGGEVANLEAVVSSTITGGTDAEETEELRRNLHYWPTYDETLVWDEDYNYFLKRRFSDLLFVQAWGEQQAEEMAGYSSLSFINKIFICAYANRDDSEVQSDCISALEDVKLLNRKFEWVDPVHVQFTIALTGKVLPDVVLTDVEDDIRTVLDQYYGKDSSERREEVYLSEIYEAIQDTDYFEKKSGARFEVEISGTSEASKLYEMVSIDLDSSTFNLEYLK